MISLEKILLHLKLNHLQEEKINLKLTHLTLFSPNDFFVGKSFFSFSLSVSSILGPKIGYSLESIEGFYSLNNKNELDLFCNKIIGEMKKFFTDNVYDLELRVYYGSHPNHSYNELFAIQINTFYFIT